MVVGGKEPQQQDKASVMKQTAELWLRQEVEQLECEADDREGGGVFVLDGSVLLSHLGRPPLLGAGGARMKGEREAQEAIRWAGVRAGPR